MYVERVESYFDFRPLQHASTYIALDGMVGKVSVSAFQNFFWIENPFIIKKVMSKNVMNPYSIFWSVCYVCRSMSKGSKVKITFNPFDIHSIEWYGWKGLFGLKICGILRKL